jgi:hypothetical protein
MELKARELKESDWNELPSWWKWWRWPDVSRETLPLNGLGGIMVYKDNINIAAGFLYLSNSNVAWLDWIISNPEYKDKDRKQALELLINTLEEVAKQQGYSVIITITKSKHLIDTHKKLGYTVDENPSYEISKKIK